MDNFPQLTRFVIRLCRTHYHLNYCLSSDGKTVGILALWLNEHHPGASVEVWLTGDSSALAKEELQARGWSIRDNAITVTVE